MPYQTGYCIHCNCQLFVSDTDGRLNSIKPFARQADLKFDSGGRVRVLICKDCAENHPDVSKIYDELMHPAATAFKSSKHKTLVQEKYGTPLGLENIQTLFPKI